MVGECDHHFLWTTAAACPRENSESGSGTVKPADITCTVSDPVTGMSTFPYSRLTL